MGEGTKIEWASASWSPWIGCTKISAGCAKCYASELMDDRYGKVKWGPNGTRVKTSESYWRKPLGWEKAAAKSGEQVRVFPSLCDVFEDWGGPIMDSDGSRLYLRHNAGGQYYVGYDQPLSNHDARRLSGYELTLYDLRRDFFRLIDATPHLTWLILTKRPENILRMWPACSRCKGSGRVDMLEHCPTCRGIGDVPNRANFWLGVSCEDQATADERIPELLKCRDLAPVLWVSYYPAISRVNFRGMLTGQTDDNGVIMGAVPRISWLVIGGESGPGARPFDIAWGRSALAQCQAAGVACFFKQTGSVLARELGLADIKGGDVSEPTFPNEFIVREYPSVS